MTSTLPALSARQRRFVEEYVASANGTQAAIKAGYSPSTASVQASRLLAKDKIRAAIQVEAAPLREKLQITQERVVEETGKLGFSDLRDVARWNEEGLVLLPSDEIDADAAAAIKKITSRTTKRLTKSGDEVVMTYTTIELHDKVAALDKLAKLLGLYTERIDLEGDIDVIVFAPDDCNCDCVNGGSDDPH